MLKHACLTNMPKTAVKADAVLLLTVDYIAQETTGSVCFSQMDAFYCALS